MKSDENASSTPSTAKGWKSDPAMKALKRGRFKNKDKATLAWNPPTNKKGVQLAGAQMRRVWMPSANQQTKWRMNNEEVMVRAVERRKSLSMRVQFLIRTAEGHYVKLRGRTIVLRRIPSIGKLWQIVERVENLLKTEGVPFGAGTKNDGQIAFTDRIPTKRNRAISAERRAKESAARGLS